MLILLLYLQYSFQGSAQYQLYNLRVHWNSDFQVDGIVNNGRLNTDVC